MQIVVVPLKLDECACILRRRLILIAVPEPMRVKTVSNPNIRDFSWLRLQATSSPNEVGPTSGVYRAALRHG